MELIVTHQGDNGDVLVNGRELHEFLEVKTRYNDWFERMIGYGFEENQDYVAITQKRVTAQGNTTVYVDHHLKLDMAKEISMIQRTDKGKQARQYFLEIERRWNSPEMIMKRALEFADMRVKQLETEVQSLQPKALFADAVATSHTSILVGDLAKLLRQNGIDIGQNRLFDWLRDNGFLISRKGESRNMPTQRSMELGIFEIKERTHNNPDGSIRITKTPKVTGKGQVYFINKFMNESVSIN
ncbi:phage antirepressor KilAC domain-containing protein [Alkalibacterium sp. MB6]|uniref:phage antirepressor KilAC domain-containing protein n=1 Tax=Alkalibacterium sp. MB6 TaxID=2081965 RepID=UPI001F01A31E|nr:phage antirepressor KilAC domain-containing protein [Alkalibacterium sp. MB6]